jgi:hypothetical protein
MAGGLMQLVAYGAQDTYLTGNPQITFFKIVHRRYTNFSVESIEQTFNGTADFGNKVTATISRNGDLIGRMYLEVKLPEISKNIDDGSAEYDDYGTTRWKDNLGHALLKTVELQIGGQMIDRQYGRWMHIWNELTLNTGVRSGFDNMVGTHGEKIPAKDAKLYIPLEFWFCRNPGHWLPLIALQYHECKCIIEFEKWNNLLIDEQGSHSSGLKLEGASLFVDYCFLDTDERRRFAQQTHEYLIEQVQFTGSESITGTNQKVRLNFNHPVKELVWVVEPKPEAMSNPKTEGTTDKEHPYNADPFNFALYHTIGTHPNRFDKEENMGVARNPVVSAYLQLNGHDRFAKRDGSYFDMVQTYQHHTNTPKKRGINVYSFALKPEDHQPSGSCNMSRIDTATLNLTIDGGVKKDSSSSVSVYAVSYNVLRIMSGMGGLAYSN